MHAMAMTFVVALGLSFAIFVAAMRPGGTSRSVRQRLAALREPLQRQTAAAKGAELEQAARSGLVRRIGDWLERHSIGKRLRTLLVHAGSEWSVGGVALRCVGCAAACGVAGHLYSHLAAVGVAGIAVGGAAPYVWLRQRSARRMKAFHDALPGAIELMARSLRAGHAMGMSIEMIAEQSPEPLAGEFAQVYQQQRLGLQFRDALLQMGERVPSKDLRFLITAILVQRETGGDLTEILDRTSHVIRERIRIEGEVRTRSAQGRMTGWILGLLPLAMLALINLVSPGYSAVLFHDPVGQEILLAGAVLIAVGGLVIRRVVDVQV